MKTFLGYILPEHARVSHVFVGLSGVSYKDFTLKLHFQGIRPQRAYSHNGPDRMCRSLGCLFPIKIVGQDIIREKKIMGQGVMKRRK